VQLFRWEKEEKLRRSGKLALLAMVLPSLVLGGWRIHQHDSVGKTKMLYRQIERDRALLIRGARIFTGDGGVIESGAVFVRSGKIAGIFRGPAPAGLKADSIEAAGKTLVPGLIDARVELTAPGGLYDPPRSFRPGLAARRALAAYLYCGATAVRSVEDAPGLVEPLGNAVASGEYLGAEVLTKPRRAGDAYTPALSVLEGQADLGAGDSELLNGTLVEQVGPLELIRGTRKALASHSPGHPDDAAVRAAAGRLMNAYRAGALLVAGSGAGSTLVFHGPSVQRELELWVKAGIPPREALQAATSNAARWLGVDARIGAIRAGNDADLLLVDGNPLEDITALERVSEVIFKGERVDRAALFEGE